MEDSGRAGGNFLFMTSFLHFIFPFDLILARLVLSQHSTTKPVGFRGRQLCHFHICLMSSVCVCVWGGGGG